VALKERKVASVEIHKFDFYNKTGQLLSGRLELPIGQPKAFAVFAHCFTCSKNVKAATSISRALANEGIGVLRFDFTGLGNSEGDFANTNFSSNVADLISAAESLEEQFEFPAILVGHSLGGAAVLKAATLLDKVKAIVTIGAPSCASHVKSLFKDSLDLIKDKKTVEIDLYGRRFTISDQFIKDINEADILGDIAKSKKTLLIMHSPTDNIVSIEHAAKIFHSAKHPKSFISLDEMDHLVSKEADARYLSKIIAAWVSKYLDFKTTTLEAKDTMIVSSQDGHKFLNRISVGNHQVFIDEPLSVGGGDLGMTPYQFLLAALGGCSSMTMKLYADNKGLPLEKVQIELSHKKVEKDGAKVDHIVKKMTAIGEALTEEQKQKLYEIAEKCPVNRTLKSEIIIESIYN